MSTDLGGLKPQVDVDQPQRKSRLDGPQRRRLDQFEVLDAGKQPHFHGRQLESAKGEDDGKRQEGEDEREYRRGQDGGDELWERYVANARSGGAPRVRAVSTLRVSTDSQAAVTSRVTSGAL